MEPIDLNAFAELVAKQITACDGPMLDRVKELISGGCPPVCSCLGGGEGYDIPPLECHCNSAHPLYEKLNPALKACGGEFYIRCPGFDDLARVCNFDPAMDAVKFKEKVLLDRIAQLEARVQELDLKTKG